MCVTCIIRRPTSLPAQRLISRTIDEGLAIVSTKTDLTDVRVDRAPIPPQSQPRALTPTPGTNEEGNVGIMDSRTYHDRIWQKEEDGQGRAFSTHEDRIKAQRSLKFRGSRAALPNTIDLLFTPQRYSSIQRGTFLSSLSMQSMRLL